MSAFAVYALRLTGECEARYVGQTGSSLNHRRKVHFADAKSGGVQSALCGWLRDNQASIEIVPLAYAASREEAREIEAKTIGILTALGHRLLNCHHVPAHLRASHELPTPSASL